MESTVAVRSRACVADILGLVLPLGAGALLALWSMLGGYLGASLSGAVSDYGFLLALAAVALVPVVVPALVGRDLPPRHSPRIDALYGPALMLLTVITAASVIFSALWFTVALRDGEPAAALFVVLASCAGLQIYALTRYWRLRRTPDQ